MKNSCSSVSYGPSSEPFMEKCIVVLNGASSSGKTSTAIELKSLLGPQTICLGLDDILEREKPFGSEHAPPFVRNLRILWFHFTDGRLGLFKKLHRESVRLYEAGYNVIIETAWMDPRALRDAAVCFAPLHAFLIGMKPPLEVSEGWERNRQDRPKGQARKHYNLVHAHGVYDLLVDPSQMSPRECAVCIMERLADAPPSAFRQLRSQKT